MTKMIRHMFFGPSGLMKMESYQDGELFITQKIQYEGSGQMKSLLRSRRGARLCGSKQQFGNSSMLIEAWNYGRNDVFLSHYTNVVDKETGARTPGQIQPGWKRFGPTRMARDHEIVSFWQEASATPQPGSRACFDIGPKSDKCEMCVPTEISWGNREFLDEAKRIPMHTEFRDAHQQVQMTGDYRHGYGQSRELGPAIKVFVWAGAGRLVGLRSSAGCTNYVLVEIDLVRPQLTFSMGRRSKTTVPAEAHMSCRAGYCVDRTGGRSEEKLSNCNSMRECPASSGVLRVIGVRDRSAIRATLELPVRPRSIG